MKKMLEEWTPYEGHFFNNLLNSRGLNILVVLESAKGPFGITLDRRKIYRVAQQVSPHLPDLTDADLHLETRLGHIARKVLNDDQLIWIADKLQEHLDEGGIVYFDDKLRVASAPAKGGNWSTPPELRGKVIYIPGIRMDVLVKSRRKTLFYARNPSGSPFTVEFTMNRESIQVTCNCQYGALQQLCRHQSALIAGDTTVLANPLQARVLAELRKSPEFAHLLSALNSDNPHDPPLFT